MSAGSELPPDDLNAPPHPRDRARRAVQSGRPEVALAWAMISIAEDLAEIRRDLRWLRQQGRRGGG